MEKHLYLALAFAISIIIVPVNHAKAEVTETVNTLNIKQTALLKQLNYIDQVSDIHGRYLVLRDSYLFGQQGAIETSKPIFTNLDAWISRWPAFLERLAFSDPSEVKANISGTTGKLSLKQQYSNMVRELDKILVDYTAMIHRNRDAILKIKAIPTFNIEEFDNLGDTTAESVNLIRQKNMKGQVERVITQINELERNFQELNASANGKLTAALQKFKDDVFKVMILKVAIYSLQFPELEETIERFERVLRTDKAMDSLLEKSTTLYKNGSRSIMVKDFHAAEQAITKLEMLIEKDFLIFSNNKNFDTERVAEAQGFAKANLADAKAKLYNGFQTQGGRRQALVNFITRNSDSIAPLCAEGSLQRKVLDCNLFRKNVAPLVNILKQGTAKEELGEPQLEIIARSLRDVIRGPLNGEN